MVTLLLVGLGESYIIQSIISSQVS